MARTVAKIDQKALIKNLSLLRSIASRSKILGVVKNNAYGHDLKLVVDAIQDYSDGFCVATLDEGISLREINRKLPIWILTGFHTLEELKEIIEYNLTPVVHNHAQILLIESIGIHINVVIEIDTGMGRLGFNPIQFGENVDKVESLCSISAIMSHFSSADNLDQSKTQEQTNIFKAATKKLSYKKSLANSAGIIGWPDSHLDWIRPGLSLYGVSPFSQKEIDHDFIPVMTFESCLISIRFMKKGDSIGYGGEFICPENMRVGIVGCGYGDGYPRLVSSSSEVYVAGSKKASIIGRVSMDSLAIDLRGLENAEIGDKVELWGQNIRVEDVADSTSTIANELLTRVTQRVPRLVIRA